MLQATLAEVQSAWQATSSALEAKGAAEAQQVTMALQQLRDDLAAQLPAGKLRGIEGKLAALEGSVLSAGAACCSLAPCAAVFGTLLSGVASSILLGYLRFAFWLATTCVHGMGRSYGAGCPWLQRQHVYTRVRWPRSTCSQAGTRRARRAASMRRARAWRRRSRRR